MNLGSVRTSRVYPALRRSLPASQRRRILGLRCRTSGRELGQRREHPEPGLPGQRHQERQEPGLRGQPGQRQGSAVDLAGRGHPEAVEADQGAEPGQLRGRGKVRWGKMP
jgi:hypothetical protein